MAEEAKKPEEGKKKKKKHIWGWIIGGVIILILILWIVVAKPFPGQKRAWLSNYASLPANYKADLAKYTSAELSLLYCLYNTYKGDSSKLSTQQQSDYAAFKTKYGYK